jgi:hypothetical protein
MKLDLVQSWLPEPDAGFQSGSATFSWKNGTLDVVIDLRDESVSSCATAHGQRLWEHGDVAELFVQRVGETAYHEFQISPNGYTLALAYPDLSGVASVRSGARPIEDFFSKGSFKADAELTATGWLARFSIPLDGIPGDTIRVSCCRYDAAADRNPIISSTSLLSIRDFHRPQEWRELVL